MATANWDNIKESVQVTSPVNLINASGERTAQVCHAPCGLCITVPPTAKVEVQVVEGQIIIVVQ